MVLSSNPPCHSTVTYPFEFSSSKAKLVVSASSLYRYSGLATAKHKREKKSYGWRKFKREREREKGRRCLQSFAELICKTKKWAEKKGQRHKWDKEINFDKRVYCGTTLMTKLPLTFSHFSLSLSPLPNGICIMPRSLICFILMAFKNYCSM